MARFEFLIPGDLREELQSHCERHGVSAADVIRAALRMYLMAENRIPHQAVAAAAKALAEHVQD